MEVYKVTENVLYRWLSTSVHIRFATLNVSKVDCLILLKHLVVHNNLSNGRLLYIIMDLQKNLAFKVDAEVAIHYAELQLHRLLLVTIRVLNLTRTVKRSQRNPRKRYSCAHWEFEWLHSTSLPCRFWSSHVGRFSGPSFAQCFSMCQRIFLVVGFTYHNSIR